MLLGQLLLWGDEAQARSFTVGACDAAVASGGANGSWVVVPRSVYAYKACPSESFYPNGGLVTRLSGRTFGAGEYSRIGFYAAPGTTIQGITWAGSFSSNDCGHSVWSNELLAQGSTTTRLYGGQFCGNYSSGNVFLRTPPGTTRLLQNTQCAAARCSSAGAVFRTFAAAVLINDPSPPSLAITGGGLSGRAGWVRGTQALTVSASDNTGIKLVRMQISGARGTFAGSKGGCNYTVTAPCTTGNGAIAVQAPTSGVADGHHTVTVTAYDAADNATTRATRAKIDNHAPAAPVPRLEGGAGWRGSNAFTAHWASPEMDNGARAPITAVRYLVCRAGGAADCARPRTVSEPYPVDVTPKVPGEGEWDVRLALVDSAGNGAGADANWSAPMRLRYDPQAGGLRVGIAKLALRRKRIKVHGRRRTVRRRVIRLVRSRRVSVGRRVEIRGRLTARGGRPRRGATIAIYSRPRQIDGRESLLGSVRTDGDGRFSYLARARRSRSLRFAYRGLSSTVRVLVPARLSFLVSPRSVINGEAVIFRGGVRGRIPPGGKQVVIQAYSRGKWRTFQLLRTDPRGRFRHLYRFDSTRGKIVYPLRAVAPREATFPYEAGISRVRRVTVRGL